MLNCNRSCQVIHIHPSWGPAPPPHSFFPPCLSLSYLLFIPPLLQDLPAVPPLACPLAPSPPSLPLPQHPPLLQQRNCPNCTLPPQTLVPPSLCTPPRSPLPSLRLFCLPGGLSHQRRRPFCPFLLLHGPLFVVALIRGLLLPSSQGRAPPQRRGAYLCPHALCTFRSTRLHHLHIESMGVVRPWTVP